VQFARLVVIVTAAGGAVACGRLGFDPEPQIEINGEGLPVANLMCAGDRTAMGDMDSAGQLAITATGDGFYAAWTGTTEQPASIVKLDAQFRVVVRQILGPFGPHLNGVLPLGGDVLAAYGNNDYAFVDMWKFSSDLSIQNYYATYAGLPARGPFLSNPAGTQRAYLWSYNNNLVASHMDSTGYAAQGSSFPMTGNIVEVAADNGVGDTAAVWIEDLGGGTSRCTAGNIRFDTPTLPALVSTRPVSSDCRRARIAAGPSKDDWLVVSTTAAGALEARYSTARGDVLRTLSSSGRAPKVRFDGTQFWIAWLDNRTGALRVATLDLGGNVVTAAQAGPRVASDEGFDLVRSGDSVYLVVLGTDALDLVTLCY
jgi:hypothetical protein